MYRMRYDRRLDKNAYIAEMFNNILGGAVGQAKMGEQRKELGELANLFPEGSPLRDYLTQPPRITDPGQLRNALFQQAIRSALPTSVGTTRLAPDQLQYWMLRGYKPEEAQKMADRTSKIRAGLEPRASLAEDEEMKQLRKEGLKVRLESAKEKLKTAKDPNHKTFKIAQQYYSIARAAADALEFERAEAYAKKAEQLINALEKAGFFTTKTTTGAAAAIDTTDPLGFFEE
jgi:hypothetical protein